MKSLSSLERIVLECIGKEKLNYSKVLENSGLHENVCFNILQALIIRGLLKTDGSQYWMNTQISPLMEEEINSLSSRQAESLEFIEAVIEKQSDRVFKFQKIALDDRDEKIFKAMLTNLETFLVDCHKKSQAVTPVKSRKVVFWGMGEVNALMNQMITGVDA